MTTAVKQLVSTFESLPAAEQREAVIEILRRASVTLDDLPEESLVEAADELFQKLDAEETDHAAS